MPRCKIEDDNLAGEQLHVSNGSRNGVLSKTGPVAATTSAHRALRRKLRIAAAISSQCVSSAKWPVSKKRTFAPGMSRLNASAPGGRKKGSFFPQTAKNGGLCLRK